MRKVPHVRPRLRGAALVAGAAAGAVVCTLLGGNATYAAPADEVDPAPAKAASVEVSVGNGGKVLREGDSTRYTITLRNRTARTLRGLTVAQTMPASLHPSGTAPEADLRPGRASWRTDLPAKASVDLTLDGDIGTIAEHEAGQPVEESDPKRPEAEGDGRGKTAVRLSTNVCVQESVRVPGGKPGRRGVDDGSGAGPADNTVGRILNCASDADVLHAARDEAAVAEEGSSWWYGALGAALLAAGAGAYAVYRRTRSRAA